MTPSAGTRDAAARGNLRKPRAPVEADHGPDPSEPDTPAPAPRVTNPPSTLPSTAPRRRAGWHAAALTVAALRQTIMGPAKSSKQERSMKLRFLGKESKSGDSPTLYASDRDTYLVQGYRVEDREILTALDLPTGQTCVEIYDRLLGHLAADGVAADELKYRVFPIVHTVDDESCIVQGTVVTDAQAREEMRIPEHEDCVEIPKAQLAALMGEQGWT